MSPTTGTRTGGGGTPPRRGAGATARRLGCAIAVAINGALLYVVNVWPGWQVLPFLTADTRQVLDILNISLIVGIIVTFVCLVLYRPWVKAFGDLVTVGIGLAVLVRIWQVFPFDFRAYSFDWALLARILLVITIVGSAIGIIANFVLLIRSLLSSGRADRSR